MLAVILIAVLAIIAFLIAIAIKLKYRFLDIDKKLLGIDSNHSRTLHSIDLKLTSLGLETQNSASLYSLDFQYPVFIGHWSVDSFFFRWITQFLAENHPKCIVEIGSGSSTLIIARLLQRLNYTDVRHIAIDHDERYLNLTKQLALLNDLDESIEFIHAPLADDATTGMKWYDLPIERLSSHPIDLLIVDGPPADLQPLSRYPAVPILIERLNNKSTVVLDDANREAELEIAQRWADEFPHLSLQIFPNGHGLAVLTADSQQ